LLGAAQEQLGEISWRYPDEEKQSIATASRELRAIRRQLAQADDWLAIEQQLLQFGKQWQSIRSRLRDEEQRSLYNKALLTEYLQP